jgi:hypothetical protein
MLTGVTSYRKTTAIVVAMMMAPATTAAATELFIPPNMRSGAPVFQPRKSATIKLTHYPGSHPGEHQSGTAASFDEARAGFERAWAVFLSNRTEADFQSFRRPNTRPRNGRR